MQELGQKSNDLTLKQFLLMLIHMRCVILQDCAVLFSQHPALPLFQHPPFSTAAFRQFAATS
ncbi:hypothetical protein C8R42DRAFT_682090 [Lentinula raphanica]|nr:hypothetical protein C8R42DRAFT_682090 [Lentinula raphanica]